MKSVRTALFVFAEKQKTERFKMRKYTINRNEKDGNVIENIYRENADLTISKENILWKYFEQLYGRSVGDSIFYFAHGFKKVWEEFLFLTEMGGKIILKGNEKRDCETMKKVLLIRYGEIALKGQNRKYFEDTLKNNIAARLKNYKDVHIRKGQARIEVHFENSNMDELIDCIRDVFGIAYISKALVVESNMENICAGADELYEAGKTFKIESRRGDKAFAFTSPEISARVGGYILKHEKQK